MFDPSVGKWTTLDPIGFAAGDPNLYRYVGNSPTNRVDPSGLADLGVVKAKPPSDQSDSGGVKGGPAPPTQSKGGTGKPGEEQPKPGPIKPGDAVELKCEDLSPTYEVYKPLKPEDVKKWDDFTEEPGLPFAFMAVKFINNSQNIIRVVKDGDEYVASVTVPTVRIVADMDKKNSKVRAINDIPAVEKITGTDVFAHELLHLKISQYMAIVYSERLSKYLGQMVFNSRSKDKQDAVRQVTKYAENAIAAYLRDLREQNAYINNTIFDGKDGSNHARNAVEEAKWQNGFEKIIEKIFGSDKRFRNHYLNVEKK
jgi:hypothetical protein